MTYAQAETIKRKAPLMVYVKIIKKKNTFAVYMASIFNNLTTTSYKRALDWIR